MSKAKWLLVAAVICAAAGLLYSQLPGRKRYRGDHKLIILGIDGMDPQLLEKFMQEGKMPHFAALVHQGSFRPLTTAIPPQSPVAWS
ncbi:MAG TPA: alkaline phosphatase family protein, partial [Terriglobales bacterium]|nr:alkaline phosphatase family protein [Terriglobales bacterium]